MKNYCNREKAAASNRLTRQRKREERYALAQPSCRFCGAGISFADFCKGRKDLCKSKDCRSIINRENSLKQDKTKISEYIRSSEKWIDNQREFLIKKRSRIETSYSKIFDSLFDNVQKQVHFHLPDNKHLFADFVINGVAIEIDGPFHQEDRDKYRDALLNEREMRVIRIDVTRHWTKLFEEIGDVVNSIKANMGC